MTATLLRDVFGDKEAALRASQAARQANEEAQRLAQQYIRMANEALRSTSAASVGQPAERTAKG